MRITFKRGFRRVYFVVSGLWAIWVLYYPYKDRAANFPHEYSLCFSSDTNDWHYDNAGRQIVYSESEDSTYVWGAKGFVEKVKGKIPTAKSVGPQERYRQCTDGVSARFYPKDKNAYEVFLTDEPLYDGDQKGASWWAWLLFPLAVILPPAFVYGLTISVAQFSRWIYRGFFPAA